MYVHKYISVNTIVTCHPGITLVQDNIVSFPPQIAILPSMIQIEGRSSKYSDRTLVAGTCSWYIKIVVYTSILNLATFSLVIISSCISDLFFSAEIIIILQLPTVSGGILFCNKNLKCITKIVKLYKVRCTNLYMQLEPSPLHYFS